MTSRTILVVEDNPITRKMMRIALESEGYRVLDARDGRTAQELALNSLPDLVLQDYVLPDMDGLQLMESLRALPGEGRNIPFLVVTGLVSQLEELRARAGPSTTFLAKPIEPSRLVEIVRTLLESEPQSTGKGRRVLVVDDEVLNLKLAAMRLRDVGFEVETAVGGQEALQKAQDSPPDAILSDVLMPDMDGFALSAALRKHPRLAQVPVVLLSSAYVDAADRRLARDMGASALVVRTPDMQEAIRELREAVQAGPPPAAAVDANELVEEHRSRLQVQLDRQVARNEGLLRQGAIQAAALSVVRALAEGLANPAQLPSALGDVLVHCLDAAGLSTGLLYLVGPDGGLQTQAQAGLRTRMLEEAPGCFGHPEVLLRTLEAGGDVLACTVGVPGCPEPALYEIASRLESRSVLVIPLQVLEKRCGILLLASSSQDLAERTWLGFARTLAVQFGQTIALGQSIYRGHTSEARYRSLMEHANDAILLLDPERRIIEANQQAEELLGRTRAEIVGRSYEKLVVSEEREATVEGWALLLAEQTMRVEARHLQRGDGTRVAADISSAVVKVGEETVVLSILRDITVRQKAEAELREAQRRLHHVVSSSPAVLYSLRPASQAFLLNWVSENIERLLGYTPEEVLAPEWWATHLHPDDRERVVSELSALFSAGYVAQEYRFQLKQGGYRSLRAELRLLRDAAGAPAEAVGSWSDVTEKAQLEGQLRQSQKMEAIGQLAGGVAHDFNNLLGVITGYGELVKKKLEAGHPGQRPLEQILKAAERAASLTRQLLAFSRKQVLEPRVLDLNEVLAGVEKMLGRLIGEDVEIKTRFAADLGQVKADQGQIEQVIMNLAVNARDAMPNGGQLTLETANAALDAAYTRTHADVPPGPYVMLAVSDSGHGMDARTLSHIFEPFFTTKEEGKGTGLGLATVFGIVEQSGGHVNVYSEPGRGSTFKVYLPRIDEAIAAGEEAQPRPLPSPPGTETILLVEDAEALRAMIRETLEMGGYTVLEASQPEEALDKLRAHESPVHLMLTDVILPHMSGPELAAKLEQVRPQIRVLFMSGYTADAFGSVLAPGTQFISKPFTADALLDKLRDVLDAPPER